MGNKSIKNKDLYEVLVIMHDDLLALTEKVFRMDQKKEPKFPILQITPIQGFRCESCAKLRLELEEARTLLDITEDNLKDCEKDYESLKEKNETLSFVAEELNIDNTLCVEQFNKLREENADLVKERNALRSLACDTRKGFTWDLELEKRV